MTQDDRFSLDGVLNRINSAKNLAEAFASVARYGPDNLVYSAGQAINDQISGEQSPHAPSATSQTNQRREWKQSLYKDVLNRVVQTAALLKSLGVKRGDRVAIFSNTRPEWSECDYAILWCGAVTVSLYPSLLPDEIAYILRDSDARIVILENEELLQKLRAAQKLSPLNISEVISLERLSDLSQAKLLSEEIARFQGANVPLPEIDRESLAAIVYTSGTTGEPKGVMQTHGNHLANVAQASEVGIFSFNGSIFLYLPLAHSFARLIQHIGFLTPIELRFPAILNRSSSKIDLTALALDLREANSMHLATVPRLLEKMKHGVETLSHKGGVSGWLLKLTIANALKVYRGKGGVIDQLIFNGLAPIREKVKKRLFGADFKWAISGGAKLPEDVNEFFDALGMQIYEGYGLTETCVATNVNLPGRKKIGSVGPVFPNLAIKLAQDGEICYRGPNISPGYFNKPQATAASWDSEGWFSTGDIGRIDADGFLFITDRKKDIMVTAGGKNIPPLPIESKLKSSPFVSQVILLGEGRAFCAALFTLNLEEINLKCMQLNIPVEGELHDNQQIKGWIADFLGQVNQTLPSFEQIKRFSILPGDFSVDNGLLTPTMKLRRKVILERYKAEIEELYS